MLEYSRRAVMAAALAREIKDNNTYIVGTGLPLIGAMLAKYTHAPNARLILETGIVEGNPSEIPIAVSDLRNCTNAAVIWPQYRFFGLENICAKRGGIDAGFLSGAQIDAFGNLNSTAIGDYYKPTTRLSGSGGANGIATYFNTVITMKHERRRFVERVDYCTSPGWIDGPSGRAKNGLPSDVGPRAVITELCVMRFGTDKRLYLSELLPGVTIEQVIENTGFKMDVSKVIIADKPEESVMRILTEKVDPFGIMT